MEGWKEICMTWETVDIDVMVLVLKDVEYTQDAVKIKQLQWQCFTLIPTSCQCIHFGHCCSIRERLSGYNHGLFARRV